MQLEIGQICNGKVTGITKFGAFVELENSKKGLVHISEISNVFVKEVKNHLQEGQEVKVKVIKITDNGNKIELSIKQLQNAHQNINQNHKQPNNIIKKEVNPKLDDFRKKISATKFEDMLSKFKRLSDDKLLDVKKKSEPRKSRASHKAKSSN